MFGLSLSAAASAQAPATLTAEDRTAIQGLVSGYARTLGACAAEEYADLFAPGTGYFASGIRGQIVGREKLITLVKSERHCTAPAGATATPRPGGGSGPVVNIEVTPSGVRGIADLGAAGQYQDEYVRTAQGWRFAGRTVLTPAERAAGLDATEMIAIRRLSANEDLGDYYVAEQNGARRFRTSGVEIIVKNGVVSGRVYLKDGRIHDDVYEKVGAGQWRIKSRTTVTPAAAVERYPAASVAVEVPTDDAELVVNGSPVGGSGRSRTVETASLPPGAHRYTFAATWDPNGYTTITRTKTVELRGGDDVRVDLTVEDPADRVRVIYVPTPPDIAARMVEMAKVGGTDVVYEPGCGDARITIAAIRASARRGVCVDIDPDRARESKANVQAAGFADRIDVREGDALDVKQLSDVTVVLLYMGEHFNMLMRPVLWRELPVGARVVSHRFTMGDWQSDESVSVESNLTGGVYDLHLWTITSELKERLAP